MRRWYDFLNPAIAKNRKDQDMTAEAAKADILTVDLGERAYDIVVGPGLLAGAGARMRRAMPGNRAVIVTDETVAGLHLATLSDALKAADIEVDAIVLPAGEPTKDFTHLEGLVGTLLDRKVERTTTLVALGGGMIGDITGFVAAITLRGLPFAQVPTTLLAQVDSSVGGKTGINTSHGKNLVGAFYQPRLVLADTDVLNTLPKRELLAGYAEVVKYGLINDPGFFDWLVDHGAAVIAGDAAARAHAVLTSCAAKAGVVAADEREAGLRALLNLGHTFGHALEAEAGYGDKLLHGEAVAIGTIMAFDLSVRMGLCPAHELARVSAHFTAIGLPTGLAGLTAPGWTADRLIGHMAQDKKVSDGRVAFVLTRGIGQAFITQDVDETALTAVLEDALTTAANS